MTKTVEQLKKTFGVEYYQPGEVAYFKSGPRDLYAYEVWLGKHPGVQVLVKEGDSVIHWSPEKEMQSVSWVPYMDGLEEEEQHVALDDNIFTIKIRGYTPHAREVLVPTRAYLPYVNGCSTAQIFPPIRGGDPTLQYLDIPPFSAEQAHHIHSTARLVYIQKGKGRSLVGMEGGEIIEELKPGMFIRLDPMCPHHFDTPQGEHLICIPFHVFSSTAAEFGHPMFLGTHLMNQGE